MNIAIMGCGPGGSYLYRLLRQRKPEVKVDLYDIGPDTTCRTKSCGWGVNFSAFTNLCHEAGLNPDRYVMVLHNQIVVEDIVIRASLAVIDKPLFLEHMLDGATIRVLPPSNGYDRIIDATGRRGYLGYDREASHYEAVETRVKLQAPMLTTVFINDNSGYSWVVPLGNGMAHLGSLSMLGCREVKHEIKKTRMKVNAGSVICTCNAPIWCAGPVIPFVKGIVWGLGESIGLVSPILGTGITPAMDSARIMVEHWDDPRGYEKETLKKYGYMKREVGIAKSIRQGKMPGVLDIVALRKAGRLAGACPSIIETVKVFARSRVWLRH